FNQFLLFDGIYLPGADLGVSLDYNKLYEFEYLFQDNFASDKKYSNDLLRFIFRNFNQDFLNYRKDFQFENHTFKHLIENIYNLQDLALVSFDEDKMQNNICNLVSTLPQDKKNFYSDLCLDYPSKINFNQFVNDYFHSLSVDSQECYLKNQNNIVLSQGVTIEKGSNNCLVGYDFKNNVDDFHSKKLWIDNFVLPARNLDTCTVEFSIDGNNFSELSDGKNKLLGQKRFNLDDLPERFVTGINSALGQFDQMQIDSLVEGISESSSNLILALNSRLVDLLRFELELSRTGIKNSSLENNEMSDGFKDLIEKNVSDVETMFYIMKSELFLDSVYNTLYDLLRISIADFEQSFADVALFINSNNLFSDVSDNLNSTSKFYVQVPRYNFPLRLFSNDDLYSRFASIKDDFKRFAHNDNGLIASFVSNSTFKNKFLEDRFRFSHSNNYFEFRNFDLSKFVYQPTLNKIPLTYFDHNQQAVKSYFASKLSDGVSHNSAISEYLFKKSKDYLESNFNNNCDDGCVSNIQALYPTANVSLSTYLNTLSFLIDDNNLTLNQNTLVNKGFEFVSKYRTQDLVEDVWLQNGNALDKVFGPSSSAPKIQVSHAFLPDSLLFIPFRNKKNANVEAFDMNKTVDNFLLMLNEFETVVDGAELDTDYRIYYDLIINDFKNYINEINRNVSLSFGEFSTPDSYPFSQGIESGVSKRFSFRISPKDPQANTDCEIYFPNPHMSGMPSEFNNEEVFGGALMSTNDEFATTNIVNEEYSVDQYNFRAVRYLYKAPELFALGAGMVGAKSACEIYSPSQTFDEVFPNVNQ
ncbi:hypothetical protein HOJ01_03100, partial [bacterium]|nr:hypothetical protein [bacterium]